MKNYALVKISTGDVYNIILWDGECELGVDEGYYLIESDLATVGSKYLDGAFTTPPEMNTPKLSLDEILAKNLATRNSLLFTVISLIAPLQYAIDSGVSTEDEESKLTLLKNYSIAINRVDLEMENPVWPTI